MLLLFPKTPPRSQNLVSTSRWQRPIPQAFNHCMVYQLSVPSHQILPEKGMLTLDSSSASRSDSCGMYFSKSVSPIRPRTVSRKTRFRCANVFGHLITLATCLVIWLCKLEGMLLMLRF